MAHLLEKSIHVVPARLRVREAQVEGANAIARVQVDMWRTQYCGIATAGHEPVWRALAVLVCAAHGRVRMEQVTGERSTASRTSCYRPGQDGRRWRYVWKGRSKANETEASKEGAARMPSAVIKRAVAIGALVLAILPLGACTSDRRAAGPASAQPYAGLQERPIKALAPEQVADLMAGRGAGYALAAELNHYPGPTHVLEVARALQLSPEQERAVRERFTAMQQEAQALGRQLIEREADLEAAFRTGAPEVAELQRRTGEIAEVEGRLRAVHLAAHLTTKAILTPEQVARYDQLRGYATPGVTAPPTGAAHSGGPRGGQHGSR